MSLPTVIDCRSEQGITVGLIDAMIAIARILAPRLRTGAPPDVVLDALLDLRSDEDVCLIAQTDPTLITMLKDLADLAGLKEGALQRFHECSKAAQENDL